MSRDVLLPCVLTIALTGWPGQIEQDGIGRTLERMRAAYGAVHMARVRFTEERPGQWTAPAVGVIEFAGRGRLVARVQLPDVGLLTILTDGSRIVTKEPGSEPAVRPFSVIGLNRTLPGGIPVVALFDAPRQLSAEADGLLYGATLSLRRRVQWEGGAGNQEWWSVLEEQTRAALFRLYIHPESHLIWRVERIDRHTGELVYASTIESIEIMG